MPLNLKHWAFKLLRWWHSTSCRWKHNDLSELETRFICINIKADARRWNNIWKRLCANTDFWYRAPQRRSSDPISLRAAVSPEALQEWTHTRSPVAPEHVESNPTEALKKKARREKEKKVTGEGLERGKDTSRQGSWFDVTQARVSRWPQWASFKSDISLAP